MVLHEIMLSLAGHGSNLFIKNGSEVDPDLPNLHPSEIVIMNKLIRVGLKYKELDSICHAIRKRTLGNQKRWLDHPSMYEKAIGVALEEILDSYLESLTQLEQRIRKKMTMPLSFMMIEMRNYEILFPRLVEICHDVKNQKLRGGWIIDYLESQATTGVPIVKKAVQCILQRCYEVMVKNLTSWMVYGVLEDRYMEFFITSHQDQQEKDSLSHLQTWTTQFTLREDMIPRRLTPRLAKKILFIGKAIKILQQPIQSELGELQVEKSISQNVLYQYAEALKQHEREGLFNMNLFEFTIDKIQNSVATHLWNLIIVDSDFASQLMALKNYFLIGKGDFFQGFLDETKSLMFQMPTSGAHVDLQHHWKVSSRLSNAELDPYFEQFSIHFQTNLFQQQTSNHSQSIPLDIFTLWNNMIKLECQVKWPLHLLFQKNVLDRYNKLFQFLFSLKRIQYSLQQAWIPLIRQKRLTKGKDKIVLQNKIFLLRSSMAFIIDNLHSYIHADVIDVQFQKLTQEINELKNFDAVRRAHNHFLTNISSQSFLNSQEIRLILNRLFDICLQLCLLIEGMGGQSLESTPQLLQTISKKWQNESLNLYQHLSNIKVISPNLNQLLLRIDYNKHFDSK